MATVKKLLDRLAKDPFRLFFPLGFLASTIGVSLWPAVFQGWLDYYPLEAHARWMALAFGGNLIVGFLGTADHHRSGHILRAATVAVHIATSVPGLVSWSRTNGLGVALRLVLPCAIGGWLLAAGFQPMRAGMLHLMFIGAAGLLMFGVATRVILGHGERHDRLASPMRWCHVLWALVLFTAATRLSADFFPAVRVSHYTYAAILWVVTLAFWAWKIRAEFRRSVFREPEASFGMRLPALPPTPHRHPPKPCSDTGK